jgi:ABC-2 type transport system ATP-binding protein
MPALEILGLQKNYTVGFWRKKEKEALKPLHLTVEENEVFGFLGPNGAGKTTTLKLLMGLIYPTSGSARILGRDWRTPEVRSQVGFLPEQPYFYDYLTAAELLDYYAALSGIEARERKRRAAEMLSRVGLSDAAHMQLRKFSKGMLQRVGIAQAILHDPKIIFLDEPTSGLDPMGRREVRDLIHSLQDQGKTIFFSTHILSDAESLCDRVAVIHQGELRGIGVVAELMNRNGEANKTEIVWNGTQAMEAIRALGATCRTAGDTVRATIKAAQLDTALEVIRRQQGRILSVTPVRTTLEDYFLQQLGVERYQPAVEVSR